MADGIGYPPVLPSIAEVEAIRSELVDGGYRPVEILNWNADHKDAGKAPIRSSWQHGPDIGPALHGALNTGILCTGLRAIDIDIDNPTIGHAVRRLAMDMLGEAPMRYRDNSPRVLFLYRAAEGEPGKRTVASKAFGKVEVLGRGQQFVAYGIHHTGAALQWMPEGPRTWTADALPAVTEDQITEFLEKAGEIIGADKPSTNSGNRERSPLGQLGPVFDVVGALAAIPNGGAADWEWWNKIGLATWGATDGSEMGRCAWHEWSARHPAYDEAATEARWQHYRTSPPGAGAGTLYAIAREHGWKRDRPKGEREEEGREEQPKSSKPGKFALLDTADLMGLKERGYLLKGIMSPGELSVWWGPPKCGKSFLMLHTAYALAQGRSVFGRRVKQCRVLYLACEGKSGLRARVEALWRQHDHAPDFKAIAQPVDLWSAGGDTKALRALIAEHRPDLVVVDTVNRVLAGGDENSSADMGALIRHLDELRQPIDGQDHGPHVACIHHGTKAGSNGPRGHGSLLGAVDASIEVAIEEDGTRTAKLDAMKDDARGALAFKLEPVTLDVDADGDPRTTCIVKELTEAEPKRAGVRLTTTEAAWFADLEEMFTHIEAKEMEPAPGEGRYLTLPREYVRDGFRVRGRFSLTPDGNLTGADRERMRSMLNALKNKGKIGLSADRVWQL
jgi:hypothetical protein